MLIWLAIVNLGGLGARSDGTHNRQFKKIMIEKPSLRGDRRVDEAIQKSD